MSEEPKALDLESMSAEEIRTAFFAEQAKGTTEPEADPTPEVVADAIPDKEPEPEEEIEEYIVHREIDLGDGSGIQVFTGKGATKEEAYEAFADKLVDAQAHATKKINELTKRIKVEDTRTEQQKADEAYVLKQRLQNEPEKVISEAVDKRIAEREAISQRHFASQVSFVNTHPDYIADPKTGNAERIQAEFQRLYPNEPAYTEEGLDKAYQSLKRGGLLQLKTEGASVTTDGEVKETQRIAETKTEPTQTRSPKKSSTVSVKGTRASVVVKTEPSEDELYAMPEAKLRELANAQLAERARQKE